MRSERGKGQGDPAVAAAWRNVDGSPGMANASVSHHFTVPKQAGLIVSRQEGQQIFYALNTTVVEDLAAILWDMLAG